MNTRSLSNDRAIHRDGSSVQTAFGSSLDGSEDALAAVLTTRFKDDWRYTPGMGWFTRTQHHWVRDENRLRFHEARLLCRELGLQSGDARLSERLRSTKTANAVLTMVQSDPRIVLSAAEWDRDQFELNTPAGIVDLRSGKLRAFNGEFHTKVTPVSPDAAMHCPVWCRFLMEVFHGDEKVVAFAQRLLGYCITGDRREQKIFFLYGVGANGKSTLIDTVLRVLGPYAIKLPASVLMQSPVDRHPTELAQLQGRRLAVSSELDEGSVWNEARIKELVGDETLAARFMRQDYFEFKMTQKHLIVGNSKPRLRGGDAAMARRVLLIPCLAKFEKDAVDPQLMFRLWDEASGILAWLIQGAKMWHMYGLQVPATILKASSDYMEENDDLALWMAECCEVGSGKEERAGELYSSFVTYMKSRGLRIPSARVWGERMSNIPGMQKRRSDGIRYEGLRLVSGEMLRSREARLVQVSASFRIDDGTVGRLGG